MQLSIFEAQEARDLGINKAVNHADSVHTGWSEKAYNFLANYVKNNNVFMTEEVRDASKGLVPEPPSNRAWGAVVLRAAKSGLIKKIGYGQTKNPKAHNTPATLWGTN